MNTSTRRMAGMLACLAAGVILALPDALFAQGFGGTTSGGRGGGKKGRGRDDMSLELPRRNEESRQVYGSIIRFKAMEDEKDPDLMGIITVKPFVPGRTYSMYLRKRENFTVLRIGNHDFPLDREHLPDALVRGLHCTVDWEHPKDDDGKPKTSRREVTGISFASVDVEGKIEKIEGEFVHIRVRPKDEREWPHVQVAREAALNQAKNRPAAPPKPRPPALRKFKLKTTEETGFQDAERNRITPSDLLPNQQIEARIIPGSASSHGFLVDLQLVSPTTTAGRSTPGREDRDRPTRGGTRGGSRGGAGG